MRNILRINSKYWILFVLFYALLVRFTGALSIPYTEDEETHMVLAERISFRQGNFRLLWGSVETEHPPLSLYLAKAGFFIFGKNRIGGRALFLIFSVGGIYFIYKLMKEFLGKKEALLGAFLCSASQYHIGFSRLISDTGLLLFFTPLLVYLFFKFLQTHKESFCIVSAMTLGVAYLANEIIFLVIPALLFCIFLTPGAKAIFRKPVFYLSIALAVGIIFPSLYWNIQHDLINFKAHLAKAHGPTLSLLALSLYLGEIMVLFIPLETVLRVASVEHAFMNWSLGIVCLFGVVYATLAKKTLFIKYLLCIFWSIFIFFSLFQTKWGLFLDNAWWAQITFFPAIILASKMITEQSAKYKRFKYLWLCFASYLFINALNFVLIRENNFIPWFTGMLNQGK